MSRDPEGRIERSTESAASGESVEAAPGTPEPAGNGALGRREALKAIGAAAASLPILEALTPGTADAQNPAPAKPAAARQPAPRGGPRGTPADPDLLHPKKDWPRLLSARELATLSVLCDMIIPADAESPAASAVGVPAYINEHVSAPGDGQQRDLIRVRGGLAWLDAESGRRFEKRFVGLSQAERARICDDICFLPRARPEFQAAARFFDLVRDLSATAFYTTAAGMNDLKYVGNVALPEFKPPPDAVLRKLGLL